LESALTPERYLEVKEIFQQAVDLPPEQRPGYLDSVCGTDDELRAEVDSLLAAHEFQGTQLVDQGLTELVPGRYRPEPAPAAGRRIGAYRTERVLGEGGMGVVYEASRADDQFRQRVAVKLLKGTVHSDAALRRFRQERQILATLDHPHIARLLDGGVTPEGQPYFVLEYVDGQPINKYCEEKRLGIRERLMLFRDVCSAVQYAHQNLIVHRDLKPGNILVTPEGQVKLLDFGIAKLLREGEDDDAPLTRTGVHVMTPEYASPEQVRGAGITTSTDVYSLGVVLYELLTGTRPFHLKDRILGEMERIICEQEPTRPSTVITRSGSAATIGEMKPDRLRRALAGDLDNIVLLAMRKEPQRRYPSPEALSEDIRRHLSGEPVAAHPPTFTYRSTKFIRRHAMAVVAVCLLILSLSSGIVATWRQKLKADSEAAKARAISDFLQKDLLAQASPNEQATPDTKPDPDLTVRTALDRAAARIGGKFKSQPVLEASVRETLGKTYEDLGLYPQAQQQVQRALELRRRSLGEENPDTLTSMYELGVVYWRLGEYSKAVPLYATVLRLQRRVLGPNHHDTLSTLSDLALVYQMEGKSAQAEPLFAEALEGERRVLGPDNPDTLNTMDGLAQAYQNQGKYAQAEPLFKTELEGDRRVLGPEHPDTLITMNNLAHLYQDEGRYAQAEPLFTAAAEVKQRVLGPEHPDALLTLGNLGVLYQDEGKYGQAEPLFIRVLDSEKRVQGPEHPDTLIAINNLAALYMVQGRYAQAEPLFTSALEVKRRVLGAEHPETLVAMDNLAVLYRNEGKYKEAEPLALGGLEVSKRVLGPEHPDTLDTMNNLASLYRDEGRYVQAEPLYAQALEVKRRVLGPEHPQTIIAMDNLAGLYRDEARYPEAEALCSRAMEVARRVLGLENPDTLTAVNRLALLYRDQGRYTQAEPMFLQVLESRRRVLGPEHRDTLSSTNGLADVYLHEHKYVQAERLLREAMSIHQKNQTDTWDRFDCQSLLGASLAGQGRYADAEPLLLAGYEGMRQREATTPFSRRSELTHSAEAIVQLYENCGKPAKAAAWRKNL
jgi:serine/threonine protein kinase/Tfp pilus assembly protein PilF